MKTLKSKNTNKEEVNSTMDKSTNSKKYSYSWKFSYFKKFNDSIIRRNNHSFDLFSKPTVNSEISEELTCLKWAQLVDVLENMSEENKTIMRNIQRQCYINYIKDLESKLFPIITEEVTKLPEYKVLKELED